MIILRQNNYSLFGGLFNGDAKRLKKQFEDENGISLEEYYKSSISKGKIDTNLIKRVCDEVENFNSIFDRSIERNKNLDYLFLYSNIISLYYMDLSDNSRDILDYLSSSKKVDSDSIPVIHFSCMYCEDVIDSGYVMYSIKSKKFFLTSSSRPFPDSLQKSLLTILEIVNDTMEEDVVENYESGEFQEEYEFWEKEYYEKVKNIIKQVRI